MRASLRTRRGAVHPRADIIPYARNPRKIPQSAIDTTGSSIQEFGWRQPIVIDLKRVIIVGHVRYLAAQKLGLELVPVHVADNLTRAQIRAYRAAWKKAGHAREPRVSVSRSIFALMDDRDRTYFGRGREVDDQIGFIDERTRAIFGRSYAAEPHVLIEQLRKDEAIAEADTLLLTIPNQLGVAYNVHVIEAILTHVAPALGWH